MLRKFLRALLLGVGLISMACVGFEAGNGFNEASLWMLVPIFVTHFTIFWLGAAFGMQAARREAIEAGVACYDEEFDFIYRQPGCNGGKCGKR